MDRNESEPNDEVSSAASDHTADSEIENNMPDHTTTLRPEPCISFCRPVQGHTDKAKKT